VDLHRLRVRLKLFGQGHVQAEQAVPTDFNVVVGMNASDNESVDGTYLGSLGMAITFIITPACCLVDKGVK